MAMLARSGDDSEMKVAVLGRPLVPWTPRPWAVIVPMIDPLALVHVGADVQPHARR